MQSTKSIYLKSSISGKVPKFIIKRETKILNLKAILITLQPKETDPVDSIKISGCASLLWTPCMRRALLLGILGFCPSSSIHQLCNLAHVTECLCLSFLICKIG